jgi:predicted ATPase/DNA-binding CsgD family transcriptional regulator
VAGGEREQATGRLRQIGSPLTSLVGRAQDIAEVIGLIEDFPLVTVTGPGGVGKTRLAVETARQVAGRFPDGVWFVGLGAVGDEAQVPAEVSAVLGISQAPGRPVLDTLAEGLASRRLLLVLDNCEHVLPAVAQLCGTLLAGADDVRILATSREQVGAGGEAQYRLQPLELPAAGSTDAPGGPAAAAVLFADRARRADPRLVLGVESAPLVARLVTRLDGLPLAIELAAARVEALGLAGLADRIDDALRLLSGTDRLAAPRHRSLSAVADWSYHLLTEPEQRVFQQLAVFPGGFTLEAAEAVAGAQAGPAVLRLVDCSLLAPPQPGADQRGRYAMLQTLRDYGLGRLREAGEEVQVLAALAAYAWSVAEQATAGMEASGSREADALHWLDAEDATLGRALGWALDQDPPGAVRLAAALAPWLRHRGRLAEASQRLRAALARSSPADKGWTKAQLWLGIMLSSSLDMSEAVACYTAVIQAHHDRAPSRELVMALVGRTVSRMNLDEDPATVHDARDALALARETGDAAAELFALTGLTITAAYAGDSARILDWARQAQELRRADIPEAYLRWHYYSMARALTGIGELESAWHLCTVGLALSRQADDRPFLGDMLGVAAALERRRGNLAQARAYLGESARISIRHGDHANVLNLVDECGCQCAEAGRWADAVALWAAHTAELGRLGLPPDDPADSRDRTEYWRRIQHAARPGQLREAEERGARMPLLAAIELAVMVSAEDGADSPPAAAGTLLSPREQELVTLVARGQTNTQIAARLHISVRTVASHLDRIRDKTGYRRRADLTRLAIEQQLV